ncbi:type II toxin-antitoxin system PemK/MazF family toxin [Kineothrix sp. MB12-C1]|uniref:type II toxin-antitoxin system PemK/MazF family toxin n=1 Tax=Kineothrix sp. MB12-C1 TaxID=3070215 RepID=UPI0027D2F7B5|nr:type II toxin-antitoxin system PemK/MazF family toxin [Kineothrix sp. MB12-C1]WMC93204.1 type II toxin-antitoxin system PemK/MazF family toxin [Kineothrix sp. MB12-C1]
MENFNAKKIINSLKNMNSEDKDKKAYTSPIIKEEIKNVLEDTKIVLYSQNRERAAKYILWQGLLNQYGIFGKNRKKTRLFGENKDITYYDRNYKHGDMISIDFGTSNLGKEFAFTHTAIVVKSYTDYIIVLPVTSCKEDKLDEIPVDEQDDTMIIRKTDYEEIDSDSYIILYQIRSVSKNRIQKVIGSISDTKLMRDIDLKLAKSFLPLLE